MDNPETSESLDTQDTNKIKNTTQKTMSNTDPT
jgi:hypothetical protein